MPLTKYKQKRNFKKTSEPKVKVVKKKSKKLIYCIQKHHASHLHWDLRLEMKGVLKSWAIPKTPPIKKGIKRLAIMTEDHPLGYEKFVGEIPEGQYGAGKVKIWDSGFYELKDKDKKIIEIIIHGKKLKGNYVLVKTHYGNKPEKSWLFMKI
jgi:DNA ligase D-like protein (predicted 3'-phosphoesterase)|tara:strand:- start:464 stop:919 length:456 start_codon:yes stop_codon:yes gene_type:complete